MGGKFAGGETLSLTSLVEQCPCTSCATCVVCLLAFDYMVVSLTQAFIWLEGFKNTE